MAARKAQPKAKRGGARFVRASLSFRDVKTLEAYQRRAKTWARQNDVALGKAFSSYVAAALDYFHETKPWQKK